MANERKPLIGDNKKREQMQFAYASGGTVEIGGKPYAVQRWSRMEGTVPYEDACVRCCGTGRVRLVLILPVEGVCIFSREYVDGP